MKYLLFFFIQAYWFLIPKHKRRRCIFSESCSKYVYRITKTHGFFLGIKAMSSRFKSCRPNYQIIHINNQKFLLTADHQLYHENQMRSDLK